MLNLDALKYIAFLMLFVLAALVSLVAGQQVRATYVIRDVNVIPMNRPGIYRNIDVLIRDGKIERIGNGIIAPESAEIINGAGRYLIPGLTDMHAHLFSDGEFPDGLAEDELKVMVANGVTGIRFMIGTPEQLKLREMSRNGKILAPRIFSASPQLSGRAFGDPFNGYEVTTPEAAREAVRSAKAAGYDFIKLTFFISLPVYEAAVDEASKQGIKVIGHVDRQVGLRRALEAGQQVEHLDGYFEAMLPENSGFAGSTSGVFVWRPEAWQSLDVLDEDKIEELAELTVEKSPYTVPTLTFLKLAFGLGQSDEDIKSRPDYGFLPDKIREEMNGPRSRFWENPPTGKRRERYVELRNRIVKAIYEAGGKVMAGSDAPEWFLLYGYTLHRELESLRDAGLSNYAVLEAATKYPAEFLGTIEDSGTVEEGKRADLLLLEANPLMDVSNTRRIAGVMVNGRWLPADDIEKMLEGIKPKFRAAFDK